VAAGHSGQFTPMRLPVNTVIHTTLVGLKPATFRSLVWRATSSATDDYKHKVSCLLHTWWWEALAVASASGRTWSCQSAAAPSPACIQGRRPSVDSADVSLTELPAAEREFHRTPGDLSTFQWHNLIIIWRSPFPVSFKKWCTPQSDFMSMINPLTPTVNNNNNANDDL